jgi:transcriptional regulator with XRE-family HTH domain
MSKIQTPPEHIRRQILRLTQGELAEQTGVNQSSVSRWEKRGSFPPGVQVQIREMALSSGRAWSDSWFFEVPGEGKAA